MKVFIKKVTTFCREHKTVVILAAIGIVVIIVGTIICGVVMNDNEKDSKKKEESITANTNKKIIEEETYEGLKFSNISLLKDKGQYTMTVDVSNPTKETSNVIQVDIPLTDKDGNKVVTLLGYIGEDLKPNETRTITASTGADLSKVVDKDIVKHEQLK